MSTDQRIAAIESRYVQGLIDWQTAVDLINELRDKG